MLPPGHSLLTHRLFACRRSTLSLHPFAPARAAFSTSLVSRHNTSAASTTAQNVQRTEQSTTLPSTPQAVTKQRNVVKKGKEQPAAPKDPSIEQQLEYLDRIQDMEHNVPFDVWARPVRLFGELQTLTSLCSGYRISTDIHIPSTSMGGSFIANLKNGMRNAFR